MAILAAAALAVAALAALTSTAGATTAVCGPASAKTLRQNTVARVYLSSNEAYGCAVGSTRRSALGTTRITPGGQRFVKAWLAGRTVAYSVSEFGIDTGSTTVVVRRLTTGRVLVQRAATTRTGVEGFQTVDALVLESDGAVAWVGSARSIGPPHFLRQLDRVDRTGFRVLDGGSAVSPRSLHLSGSRVSWLHGTAHRSTTLR